MRRKKIYKFQAIDKHSIAALVLRKTWCSKAKTLNDPYEFKISGFTQEDHEKMGEMGVTSFAERNDNPLMWAHYADKHQGICLEFSMDSDAWIPDTLRTVQPASGPKWKGGIHKMSYSRKRPILDTSVNDWVKKVMKHLLTKSADWKYEREWRCIHRVGGKLHPYVGTLSGVVFGCRTPIHDKELIKSILKNEVKFYDSKMSESEFKVEIIPHSN